MVFNRTIAITISIALHVKLTLWACENMQVPFNVWAYISAQFKPQENYLLGLLLSVARDFAA